MGRDEKLINGPVFTRAVVLFNLLEVCLGAGLDETLAQCFRQIVEFTIYSRLRRDQGTPTDARTVGRAVGVWRSLWFTLFASHIEVNHGVGKEKTGRSVVKCAFNFKFKTKSMKIDGSNCVNRTV